MGAEGPAPVHGVLVLAWRCRAHTDRVVEGAPRGWHRSCHAGDGATGHDIAVPRAGLPLSHPRVSPLLLLLLPRRSRHPPRGLSAYLLDLKAPVCSSRPHCATGTTAARAFGRCAAAYEWHVHTGGQWRRTLHGVTGAERHGRRRRPRGPCGGRSQPSCCHRTLAAAAVHQQC